MEPSIPAHKDKANYEMGVLKASFHLYSGNNRKDKKGTGRGENKRGSEPGELLVVGEQSRERGPVPVGQTDSLWLTCCVLGCLPR